MFDQFDFPVSRPLGVALSIMRSMKLRASAVKQLYLIYTRLVLQNVSTHTDYSNKTHSRTNLQRNIRYQTHIFIPQTIVLVECVQQLHFANCFMLLL